MEECDLRSAEIKKTSYEFDRDIVKGSINTRTNKVVAEKVVRYLEDKLRARVSNTVLLVTFTGIIFYKFLDNRKIKTPYNILAASTQSSKWRHNYMYFLLTC